VHRLLLIIILLLTTCAASLAFGKWVESLQSSCYERDCSYGDKSGGNQQKTKESAISREIGATHYHPACKQPKDKNDYDLCQQIRMADAAEWQCWISVLGLGVLVATLLYNAESARAASDAARISQEQLIAAHRPWILVKAEIMSPLIFRNGHVSIKIRFRCENIGGSPASRHRIFAEIHPTQTNSRFCSRHV
jgi:hypothetical protein